MILDALKKRLYRENDKATGRWMKELPAVVWVLQTQPSRNTSVSLYFTIYGAEAFLPTDIKFGSPRVKNFDQYSSNESKELEINCTEERRLDSCVRTTTYLDVLWHYYNRNVKEQFFVVGDLVLKWKTSQEGMHKLSTPCEGPFMVTEVTRPTSYILAYLDGRSLPNS